MAKVNHTVSRITPSIYAPTSVFLKKLLQEERWMEIRNYIPKLYKAHQEQLSTLIFIFSI